MCGIWGALGLRRPLTEDEVRFAIEMGKALTHRGPDGGESMVDPAGHWVVGATTLRVSSSHGTVGLTRSSRGAVLAYNGELFEAPSIADFDATVRRCGDAQILAEALDAPSGHDTVLSAVDGMFAYAHVGADRQVITLARDAFGEKPLVITHRNGVLWFASEARALPPWYRQNRPLRPEFTSLGGPIGEGLGLSDVDTLPPGALLELRRQIDGRWSTSLRVIGNAKTALRATDARLGADSDLGAADIAAGAVRRTQHVAIGPRVLLASGGLDSSILAHLMRPDVIISVSFPGNQRYDETAAARALAESVGAEFIPVRPQACEVREALPRIVDALESPAASASLVPEWFAYDAAASIGARCVVAGTGADELFLGYTRHGVLKFGPEWLLKRGLHSHYAPLRHKIAGVDRAAPLARRFWRAVTHGSDLPGLAEARRQTHNWAEADLRQLELTFTLPSLLRASDRLASAFSLERRSPFLSRRALLASAALTEDELLEDGVLKTPMRCLGRQVDLSETIVGASDKLGFAAPATVWAASVPSSEREGEQSFSRLAAHAAFLRLWRSTGQFSEQSWRSLAHA